MAAADRSLLVRTHRFDTPGPVDLKVGIKSGRVVVETWDGDETVVELDGPDDALIDEVQVDHEPLAAGHRVAVRVPKMSGRNVLRTFDRGSLEVRVRVPEQALTDIATSSGEVRLDGTYREVHVDTASGNVEIGQVSGSAKISTASGDVGVESVGGLAIIHTASADVRCGTLIGGGEIKTASGDVQIEAVTQPLTVATGSGDIEVGESESCKLRSASGDLRVGGIRHGEADLTTASGDIEVSVISGAMVAVDAESVSGDLSSEIELSSDEPDAPDGADSDRVIDLKLRSVNGDIQIRRTRAPATS
jgi:DUF4097 and DUF4098 domain-containing protein YvlB